MRRSILIPLVALVALAGVTSACRHAEAPPEAAAETVTPPGIETLPLEVVVATRLNVRAGPGAEHAVVGKLARGERAGARGDERLEAIRPDAGGLEGWVAGEYLQAPPSP
jgi:uncharacterized protein YraI